jgi:hypothetical protein
MKATGSGTNVFGISTDLADGLGLDRSLALVAGELGRAITDSERQAIVELVALVGHSPFALKLASALLCQGVSWTEISAALHAKEQSPDPAGQILNARPALGALIDLSVQQLPQEKRQAMAWLGIVSRETALTAAVTSTLWNMDPEQAQDALQCLWKRALLSSGRPVGTRPAYRMHRLVYDKARRLLTAQQPYGLGIPLTRAHALLLERYRSRCAQVTGQFLSWHTLADDGYIYAHLAWHMEQAGWTDELHELLQEETPQGQNAWYRARERLGQSAGYVDDVRRAYTLAEGEAMDVQNTGAWRRGHGWGLTIRYALVLASLNSLNRSIPHPLLTRLLAEQIWTPAQGLVCIQQMPYESQRAEVLADLAPHLAEEQLVQALGIAEQIRNESIRARALASLTPHLALSSQTRSLYAILQIKGEHWRAQALAKVCPHVAPALRERVLAAVLDVKSPECKLDALVDMAPYLPADLLGTALANLHHTEPARDKIFVDLAPHLAAVGSPFVSDPSGQGPSLAAMPYGAPADADAAHEAKEIALLHIDLELADTGRAAPDPLPFQLAPGWLLEAPEPWGGHTEGSFLRQTGPEPVHSGERLLHNHGSQASVLSRQAVWLAKSGHPGEAIETVREIKSSQLQVAAFLALIPCLGAERVQVLRECLSVVGQINDETDRSQALSSLVAHLPSTMLPAALAIVQGIGDVYGRSQSLTRLIPHLPADMLPDALIVAHKIPRHDDRTRALIKLACRLAELGRPLDAVSVAQRIPSSIGYPLLCELTHRFVELGYPQEAILAATWEPPLDSDPQDRQKPLVRLIPHLVQAGYGDAALVAAQRIHDRVERVQALATIAAHGQEHRVFSQALAVTQEIQDAQGRWLALKTLAPLLPVQLLDDALVAAQQTRNEYYRAHALAALAPYVPPDLVLLLLDLADEIINDRDRVEVIKGLVPRLIELGHPGKATSAVQEIRTSSERASIMIGLAHDLASSGYASQALRVASSIEDPRWRVSALCGQSAYLSPEQRAVVLQKALETAWGIENVRWRMEAILQIVPYLMPAERHEVFQRALDLIGNASQGTRWQARTLAALAPHLEGAWLDRALALARGFSEARWQAATMTQIVPHLLPGSRERTVREILETIRNIDSDHYRAQILAALAPYLPTSALPGAFAAARQISRDRWRTRAILSLVQNLAEAEREPILGDLLVSIETLEEGHPVGPSLRAQLLTQIAPLLSDVLLGNALSIAQRIDHPQWQAEALMGLAPHLSAGLLVEALMSTRQIKNTYWQTKAQEEIMPFLLQSPYTELVGRWRRLLSTLAHQKRSELLADLRLLTPIIAFVGGEMAAAETFRAVQDVGRWWP